MHTPDIYVCADSITTDDDSLFRVIGHLGWSLRSLSLSFRLALFALIQPSTDEVMQEEPPAATLAQWRYRRHSTWISPNNNGGNRGWRDCSLFCPSQGTHLYFLRKKDGFWRDVWWCGGVWWCVCGVALAISNGLAYIRARINYTRCYLLCVGLVRVGSASSSHSSQSRVSRYVLMNVKTSVWIWDFFVDHTYIVLY